MSIRHSIIRTLLKSDVPILSIGRIYMINLDEQYLQVVHPNVCYF